MSVHNMSICLKKYLLFEDFYSLYFSFFQIYLSLNLLFFFISGTWVLVSFDYFHMMWHRGRFLLVISSKIGNTQENMPFNKAWECVNLYRSENGNKKTAPGQT